ncbi:N-acetylgalactosaminyltransferase 6-like [Haematobia irritans]|uniref:N-acetylgalactosaminyltransferase 6-like n=1 Tax=Haematobia irritans TaxID=7368 RepID=UPI003F4FC656
MVRSKHSYSLLRSKCNSKLTYYLLSTLLSLCALSICLIVWYGRNGLIDTKTKALSKIFKQRSEQVQQHASNEKLLGTPTNNLQQLRDRHTTTNWHSGEIPYKKLPKELTALIDLGQSTKTSSLAPLTHESTKKHFEANNQNDLRLTGFNVQLAESLPLRRDVPDTRHKRCKRKIYPNQLPTCSIIIVHYNEYNVILLRTLHSLHDRTPHELLEEIILVNDASEPKETDQSLYSYIKANFAQKIRIVHLKQRNGLIRARLQGARRAKGEVLVFLDAHIEVNVNWLPPLLEPIVEDPQTSTTPKAT